MGMAGASHVAFMTNDMKAQIEFYTQIVGYKLVGIFPFHGVEGASHCFLDSGNGFLLSFVQHKGKEVEPVPGVSHATSTACTIPGGAVQHIAMAVDTMGEMLALRDRLRNAGYAVFGPLEHGICQSMYLGSPDGIQLEFATTDGCKPLTVEEWVMPESAAELGMSEADLERYTNPPPLGTEGGSVPQPPADIAVPAIPVPQEMFEKFGYLSDEELHEALRFSAPADEHA